MNEQIDYRLLRRTISLKSIINGYGIKHLVGHLGELRGPCPIHVDSHTGGNFSVDLRNNTFRCLHVDGIVRGGPIDLVAGIKHCSLIDAARDLERRLSLRNDRTPNTLNKTRKIEPGIYRDKEGKQYAVVCSALLVDTLEPIVVCRELSRDYQFWAASPNCFSVSSESDDFERFTLLRRTDHSPTRL